MEKRKMLRKLAVLGMFLLFLFCGCGRNQEERKTIGTGEMQTTVTDSTEEADSKEVMSTSEMQEKESEQEPEEPEQLSVLMVGDVLLHDRVEESCVQPDGSRNFSSLFSKTREEIRKADLAIVNQEVILGGSELGISGYPAFNAPFEVGDSLVEAGFDVVCHGTNHALDKGKKGLLNCIRFWKSTYPEVGILGIYETEQERDALYYYERNGMKIAVLNYTYGTNGISLPEGMPYAVNMLEEAQVAADIKKAEAEADFTIVCPHWGTEYQLTPSSQQKKWTQFFLEQGVDLVLGTHPHVIEPVEWVTDEATGHRMLVYYSIGNYVNWTSGTGAGVSDRMVGGMAQVNLERNKESGMVEIRDYGVKALVSHVQSGSNGVQVYPLEEYSQELAAANEIVFQAPDFSYQYCVDLCNRIWGEGWK